jgi:hypothetical protein
MLIAVLIGGAVFLMDFLAVAAITGSLWLERWLGLGRGILLDWVIIVAFCYGVAAWISGEMLKRGMLARAARAAEKDAQAIAGGAQALVRGEIEKAAALVRGRDNRGER